MGAVPGRDAHLRGARDRRRHQRQRRRPTAPSPSTPRCRTRRSPAARAARSATRRRRSRSRPRRARRSSAASTASPTRRARTRSRRRRSTRARTRSRSAPSTRPATATTRPRPATSSSTRRARRRRSTTGPSGRDEQHHRRVHVQRRTSADATFECALDGATPGQRVHVAAHTTPSRRARTPSRSAPLDAAGNTDAHARDAQTWTVDTQAPAAPAITRARATTRCWARRPSRCRARPRPNSTVEVVEGTTSRGTTTTNAAGNWSRQITSVPEGSAHLHGDRPRRGRQRLRSVAARTVIVDTGDPAAPAITAGPNGPVNDRRGRSSASRARPARRSSARSTTGEFEPCTSPKSYAGLAEGKHIVRRARDRRGRQRQRHRRAGVHRRHHAAGAAGRGLRPGRRDHGPLARRSTFTSDAGTIVECRLDGPGGPGTFAAVRVAAELQRPGARRLHALHPLDRRRGQRADDPRSFTVTTVQAAQTPTPTPTPTPEPTPVPQQTVVVGPASGTVLVKVKGSNRFEQLDVTKGIPLGSEVDVRKGRVTLTAIGKRGAPTDKAEFYDGMFVVTQSGGVTDLKLSEPLDCAKRSSARRPRRSRRSASCGARARASSAPRAPTARRPCAGRRGSWRTRARRRSRA